MSNLNLDSQLYEQALATAAAQGLSLEQFVDNALRQAVCHTQSQGAVQRTVRNGLPVINAGEDAPTIDPHAIRHALEDEGF
jgi:hypothetical protein